MALNTAIRGEQIKANEIDEAHLTASVAGDGISGGNGSALALDLNELTGVTVDVANDEVAIIDATDSSTKKESIADIVTAIAGDGLVASSGVLALDINELTQVAVDVSADFVAIEDATDNSTKKEAIADIITAVAGNGLTASSGVLALDFNELSEAVVDVANDYLMIEDVTDNSSKKEAVADLVSAIAGSGLTATNGVLSVDTITDNLVESDIIKENESANCDGIETNFTLDNSPVANSVQVFLNGMLQEEGSGKDYTLSGTTVSFATAPESGDILIIHYIINN